MKLPFKPIAILVIISLLGIFIYQGILDHGTIQNDEARTGTKHRRSHGHERL